MFLFGYVYWSIVIHRYTVAYQGWLEWLSQQEDLTIDEQDQVFAYCQSLLDDIMNMVDQFDEPEM